MSRYMQEILAVILTYTPPPPKQLYLESPQDVCSLPFDLTFGTLMLMLMRVVALTVINLLSLKALLEVKTHFGVQVSGR